MNTVLLIADHDQARELVVRAAAKLGLHCEATHAERFKSVLDTSETWSLVVIDLDLDCIDATEIIRTLRVGRNEVFVMVLTGSESPERRRLAIRAGANDFVLKPLSLQEVEARIETALMRSSSESTVIRDGALVVDLLQHAVTWNGVRVRVTPTELRILECLVRKPGVAVSSAEISEFTWGNVRSDSSNAIAVHINRLRAKLERAKAIGLIETVRGSGYRFKSDA